MTYHNVKHIQLYGKDLFWERAKERIEKENPTRLQVDDANDLMDLIKKALNAAMEPVLLLTKNEDEDTVEEINEYIDGKEELTKWLMKKDEKNQK